MKCLKSCPLHYPWDPCNFSKPSRGRRVVKRNGRGMFFEFPSSVLIHTHLCNSIPNLSIEGHHGRATLHSGCAWRVSLILDKALFWEESRPFSRPLEIKCLYLGYEEHLLWPSFPKAGALHIQDTSTCHLCWVFMWPFLFGDWAFAVSSCFPSAA